MVPKTKAQGTNVQDGGMRVTPTGMVRTAQWKIMPSSDTMVKGST